MIGGLGFFFSIELYFDIFAWYSGSWRISRCVASAPSEELLRAHRTQKLIDMERVVYAILRRDELQQGPHTPIASLPDLAAYRDKYPNVY